MTFLRLLVCALMLCMIAVLAQPSYAIPGPTPTPTRIPFVCIGPNCPVIKRPQGQGAQARPVRPGDGAAAAAQRAAQAGAQRQGGQPANRQAAQAGNRQGGFGGLGGLGNCQQRQNGANGAGVPQARGPGYPGGGPAARGLGGGGPGLPAAVDQQVEQPEAGAGVIPVADEGDIRVGIPGGDGGGNGYIPLPQLPGLEGLYPGLNEMMHASPFAGYYGFPGAGDPGPFSPGGDPRMGGFNGEEEFGGFNGFVRGTQTINPRYMAQIPPGFGGGGYPGGGAAMAGNPMMGGMNNPFMGMMGQGPMGFGQGLPGMQGGLGMPFPFNCLFPIPLPMPMCMVLSQLGGVPFAGACPGGQGGQGAALNGGLPQGGGGAGNGGYNLLNRNAGGAGQPGVNNPGFGNLLNQNGNPQRQQPGGNGGGGNGQVSYPQFISSATYGTTHWEGDPMATDMFTTNGTPILALVNGTVSVRTDPTPCGTIQSAILRGDNGYAYLFGHVNSAIRQGKVAAGEQFATVGGTGLECLRNPQKYHVHFAVSRSGQFSPGGDGDITASQYLRSIGFQGNEVSHTPGPQELQ